MKLVAKYFAVAVLVVAIMVVARDPERWKSYVSASSAGGSELPLSYFEPRELVTGGNVPPAPRVVPALELLDAQSLQEAAKYAGDRDSNALIVTRHGHIVFEQYWHGTGFDTLDESKSFVQTLTALLTGIAIGERKIGWPDEPIGNFISELSQDTRGAVTVRNLMQSDRPADLQLLAQVLERATKQRYSEYLSVELWRRLGAADAWLWLDRRRDAPQGGTVHADCCFLARQGDWIRVGELLANNGRYQGDEVVPPRWIPQMLAPVKSRSSYGATVRLGAAPGMSEPYAVSDAFVVEGGGHRLWLVPSMGIVILRTGPAPRAVSDWDDSRIANLIIRGARDYLPPQARPGADLKSLVPNH